MTSAIVPALMFPALFLLIFLGLPVAFCLMVVAFWAGWALFGPAVGIQLFRFIDGVASTEVLAAIPLFIFMGALLERSGLAERLFLAMRLWLGGWPGGLAVATITMCAIFAAATGIVGAVEVLVGIMAIPAMMRLSYAKPLIAGTICAGGSLGTIIPPSILVVIYASLAKLSIGQVLAGTIIPGLLMVVLFLAYIVLRCWLDPKSGPAAPAAERAIPMRQKLATTLTALVPPVVLVLLVVGSILAGVASPTEAAAVGAASTIVLSVANRMFSWRMFAEVLRQSLSVNAMIMFIVIGGTMFTSTFRAAGGNRLVDGFVQALALSPAMTVVLMLTIVFLLGFILEWVSILLICVPIFLPLISAAGIDPLWFGIMVIVVVQTSYLTPPMAPAIFYLKSIAPPEMTLGHMYRGVVPFIVAQLVVLLVVALAPATATYLPKVMVGF
jgi:tripartite ATP-independent transporter DctM subunit